jgi:hypothetical protein
VRETHADQDTRRPFGDGCLQRLEVHFHTQFGGAVKALDIVADTNNHTLPRFRRLNQFSRNGQVVQRRNMQFFLFAGRSRRLNALVRYSLAR